MSEESREEEPVWMWVKEPFPTPPKRCPSPPPTLPRHFRFSQAAPPSWDAALFDCASDPFACWMTALAPCVTFARVAQFADDRSTLGCVAEGGIYCALSMVGLQCCYSWRYRERLRKKLMLPGNSASDFYAHCLCECCALCQEYHQLAHASHSDLHLNGVTKAPLPAQMER